MTNMESRIRREIEEATYNNKTALMTHFRRTRPGTNTQRESVASQAFIGISHEENQFDQKWDFDLAAEGNERWASLFQSAAANTR